MSALAKRKIIHSGGMYRKLIWHPGTKSECNVVAARKGSSILNPSECTQILELHKFAQSLLFRLWSLCAEPSRNLLVHQNSPPRAFAVPRDFVHLALCPSNAALLLLSLQSSSSSCIQLMSAKLPCPPLDLNTEPSVGVAQHNDYRVATEKQLADEAITIDWLCCFLTLACFRYLQAPPTVSRLSLKHMRLQLR